MDIEKVGNVSAGAEPIKVEQPKHVEPVQIETVQSSAKALVRTEETGENKDGRQKKEHRPSEATIDDAVSKANRHIRQTK